MTSARKKCLNLTKPKGAITMLKMTINNSFLALMQKKWKGRKHNIMKIKTQANVNAATELSNT